MQLGGPPEEQQMPLEEPPVVLPTEPLMVLEELLEPLLEVLSQPHKVQGTSRGAPTRAIGRARGACERTYSSLAGVMQLSTTCTAKTIQLGH